jgi:hypothetical protein
MAARTFAARAIAELTFTAFLLASRTLSGVSGARAGFVARTAAIYFVGVRRV